VSTDGSSGERSMAEEILVSLGDPRVLRRRHRRRGRVAGVAPGQPLPWRIGGITATFVLLQQQHGRMT
jgi:hypothetical protein